MAEITVESGTTVEVDTPGDEVQVVTPNWTFEATTPAWTFEVASPEAVANISEPATDIEVLLLPGPAGPEGPQGETGLAGVYEQIFTFASPATVWTLPQTSGRRFIDVQTFDINDEEIFGDVVYFDGYTEVRWFHPTAGTARVSM